MRPLCRVDAPPVVILEFATLVAPSFRSAAADAGSGVVKEEATIEAVANPDMKTFDTSEKPLKCLPKPKDFYDSKSEMNDYLIRDSFVSTGIDCKQTGSDN